MHRFLTPANLSIVSLEQEYVPPHYSPRPDYAVRAPMAYKVCSISILRNSIPDQSHHEDRTITKSLGTSDFSFHPGTASAYSPGDQTCDRPFRSQRCMHTKPVRGLGHFTPSSFQDRPACSSKVPEVYHQGTFPHGLCFSNEADLINNYQLLGMESHSLSRLTNRLAERIVLYYHWGWWHFLPSHLGRTSLFHMRTSSTFMSNFITRPHLQARNMHQAWSL